MHGNHSEKHNKAMQSECMHGGRGRAGATADDCAQAHKGKHSADEMSRIKSYKRCLHPWKIYTLLNACDGVV